MTTPTFLYFLKPVGMMGPIKIGCSKFPESRLASVALWSPVPVETITVVPGGFREENMLHRQFANFRLHGEWFAANDGLLEIINSAIATGELPKIAVEDDRAKMIVAYCGGQTLQQIGERYGISRERVRQILRKEGVASLGYRHGSGRSSSDAERNAERVLALAATGATYHEIAADIGSNRQSVKNCLDRRGITLSAIVKATDGKVQPNDFYNIGDAA